MSSNKEPNWATGKRGKLWAQSLQRAAARGATIVVEETRVPVKWSKPTKSVYLRPWIDRRGNRYDSRECVPVFK
jgi:hypothetical protein